MAPEQLEGGEADARTDLFAFGALIYEAATGRKAFEGKSRASLIGSILRDDPLPISTVIAGSRPPSTSSGTASAVMADGEVLAAGLDRVVRRCLAKEPGDRWQTAADLLEALRWVSDGHAVDGAAPVAPPSRRPMMERLAWGTALVLVAALATWGWFRPAPALSVTRFAFDLPPGAVIGINGVALSPDEKSVVVSASTGGNFVLYRRAFDQLDAAPVRGTEAGQYPFYSPDGQWLGFFTQNGLKKVPAEGGPATLIAPTGTRYGASWGPDQTIVFASSGSPDLMIVPATGGTPKVLVSAKSFGSGSLRWPAWSLDGRAVFMTVFNGSLGASQIGVYVPDTGVSRVLLPGAHPMIRPGGELLFGRASSIWRVPFDTKTFTVGTAPPVPIAQGVQINTGGLVPASVVGNTLVYKPGSAGDALTLVWGRRDGSREPLLDTPQGYRAPSLSPDGERLAMYIVSDTEGTDREAAVWVYTIKTKALDRLTFGQGRYTDPVWTYDGRIVYAGTDNPDGIRNLYWTRADGTGVPERLTTSAREQLPRSITRGGVLIYQERDLQGSWDLYTMALAGDRKPVPFTQTSMFNEVTPAFSPDGQFVAYTSNETGQNEIFVRRLTGPGKWQVSQSGGNDAGWSPNGRELYYYAQQQFITVPVETTGSSFTMTAVPRSMFPHQRPVGYAIVVHPLDGRFILLDRPDADLPQIVVTQNAFPQTKP
jgi:serine/threonine-protein kinase